MRLRLMAAGLVAVLATALALAATTPRQGGSQASENRIPVSGTSLYARVIGQGHPVIVLHGGTTSLTRWRAPRIWRS